MINEQNYKTTIKCCERLTDAQREELKKVCTLEERKWIKEWEDAKQKRNAKVQEGPASLRLEDRAEGEEPQAGHRDHDGREAEREGG